MSPNLNSLTRLSFIIVLFAVVRPSAIGATPDENARYLSGHPDFTAHCLMLSDGTLMPYYVRPRPGPTLVLIPGTGRTCETFTQRPFADRLKSDFHVIVVESRGAGRSWPPPNAKTATIEQYATDVLELVAHLGIKSWYAGGHSLGGMISIEVAGRRPAGLRAVIPMEGTAPPKGRTPNPAEKKAGMKQWFAIRDEAKKRWTTEEWDNFSTAFQKWTSASKILEDTAYPILMVYGAGGLDSLPSRNELGIPDKRTIELLWVKGAGHAVVRPEHAAVVADAMNEFIERVDRAPGVQFNQK